MDFQNGHGKCLFAIWRNQMQIQLPKWKGWAKSWKFDGLCCKTWHCFDLYVSMELVDIAQEEIRTLQKRVKIGNEIVNFCPNKIICEFIKCLNKFITDICKYDPKRRYPFHKMIILLYNKTCCCQNDNYYLNEVIKIEVKP